MPQNVRIACPLDCFDACALVASVENGKVIKIQGDKRHPVTRGYMCAKGKALRERMYHPARLRSPMRNTKGGWRAIPWNEALDEIAARLAQVVSDHGSQSILHYFYDGYTGVIKTIDQIFFNYLGGATTYRGSLCWGAGLAAQRYDFGDILGHAPQDMARARTILIWGRNPRETGIHLSGMLI